MLEGILEGQERPEGAHGRDFSNPGDVVVETVQHIQGNPERLENFVGEEVKKAEKVGGLRGERLANFVRGGWRK